MRSALENTIQKLFETIARNYEAIKGGVSIMRSNQRRIEALEARQLAIVRTVESLATRSSLGFLVRGRRWVEVREDLESLNAQARAQRKEEEGEG